MIEGEYDFRFIRLLTNKSDIIRTLAEKAIDKNYFYGYYRALKFAAELYVNLKFPTGIKLNELISQEEKKVLLTCLNTKDNIEKKRNKGCIQAFIDISEIIKGEATWPIFTTT